MRLINGLLIVFFSNNLFFILTCFTGNIFDEAIPRI